MRIENVSFGYRDGGSREMPFALAGINIGIARGSLTGLLGPNGCGKTTMLKLMSGVLTAHSGTISLNGERLDSMRRRHIARRLAVVPQETHPAFDYSVMEIALMGRHPHLGPFTLEGPADIAIVREALAATGTAHLADCAYTTLSSGEKQRVIIASALAQAPELLLLDEPTASLDLGYQLELATLLVRLNRERSVTMVLATHDLNLAASVCTSLVLMRGGRVLTQGPTRDALTADAVRDLYDVEADVSFHAGAGHLMVVPIRRRSLSA